MTQRTENEVPKEIVKIKPEEEVDFFMILNINIKKERTNGQNKTKQ